MVDDQLLDVVGVKVDETYDDTRVCNHGTQSQFADVANKGEGDQDGKEDGDPDNLVQLGSSQTVDHNCKLLGKEDTVAAKEKRGEEDVFSRPYLQENEVQKMFTVKKTHQQNPN